MSKLLHVSKVKVEKEPGNSKVKRAQVEGFPDVLRMGVHGGVADFFKLKPDEPLPSTLDYVVAAVGGCLTGTLAGALEARGIATDSSRLQAEAEGRIEEVDGKMILTHIKVRYRVRAPKDEREAVERAIEHHGTRCPVSESVRRGITVEWSGEIVDEP